MRIGHCKDKFMFRYRFVFFIVLLFSCAGYSAEILTGSYFTWNEKMTLRNSSSEDHSIATFSGLLLSYERVVNEEMNLAVIVEFLSGSYSGGGTSDQISYSGSRNDFWGSALGLKWKHEFLQHLHFILSSEILWRDIQWATTSNADLSVESGRKWNAIIGGGMAFDVSHNFTIQQRVGTLLMDGGTYWDLGVCLSY